MTVLTDDHGNIIGGPAGIFASEVNPTLRTPDASEQGIRRLVLGEELTPTWCAVMEIGAYADHVASLVIVIHNPRTGATLPPNKLGRPEPGPVIIGLPENFLESGDRLTWQAFWAAADGTPGPFALARGNLALLPPENTELPEITVASGELGVVGNEHSGSLGTFTGADLIYERRWLADGVTIEGETGATYTPTADLNDRALTLEVTAIDPAGNRLTAVSSPVEIIHITDPEVLPFPSPLGAAHVDVLYGSPTLRTGYLLAGAPDNSPAFTYAANLSTTNGGSADIATPIEVDGTIVRVNSIPDGTTMYFVPWHVRASDGQRQPALAPTGTTANGHSVIPIPGNTDYGQVIFVTGEDDPEPVEPSDELEPISSGGLAVAVAADIPQFRRGNQSNGGYGVNCVVGPTLSAMALANLCGDNSANSRIGQYLNSALAGDSCPPNQGAQFSQMKSLWALAGFAVLRRAPYWDTLTTTQKNKITAIMKAGAVAAGFVGSDVQHPPNASLLSASNSLNMDGVTRPSSKGIGANMASSCPCSVLCAMSFFGGPSQLASIYQSYNHTAFLAELNSLGLTNIVYTWTRPNSPNAATVQNALAGTWRYYTKPLSDITGIITAGPALGHPSYTNTALGKTIKSGLNNGAGAANNPTWGKMISGASTLPNKGVPMSMWYELDAHDGGANGEGGERSSLHYATYTAENWIMTILALIVGGLFDRSDATLMAVMQRMNLAMIDYSYKLEKGYKSWSHNQAGGIHGGDFGYGYTETSAPGNGLIDTKWALRPREELWHITIKTYLGLS